ncbi:MAG: hypothetical protein JXR37_14615 [Kiritimatiellae bacterium]|nr:hypothetical protein [Kiritimatiellia bacterium]
MKRVFPLLCVAALATGCANTTELKRQRDLLAAELAASRNKVADLERRQKELQGEVQRQEEVSKVLEREKGARAAEAGAVRADTRRFIKKQVEDLKAFSQEKALLDYVGGELLDRTQTDGRNQLLIDMQHVLQAPGTLMGGKLYAKSATTVSLVALRRSGGNLVVIWQSKPFRVPGAGVFALSFEAPISVERGDLIGLFSPGPVQVPFDAGTGDTRATAGPVSVGQSIPASALPAGDRRTYSFGVVGFLE